MDFIGKPVKEEVIAFIKEQQAIIRENERTSDYSNAKEVSHRRAHNPTEEDRKWHQAHENISKAVTHVSKYFSEWHLARIRTSIGMHKMIWFFYLHPDTAASGGGMQELVITRMYSSRMYA